MSHPHHLDHPLDTLEQRRRHQQRQEVQRRDRHQHQVVRRKHHPRHHSRLPRMSLLVLPLLLATSISLSFFPTTTTAADDLPSQEELEGINSVISSTNLVQLLQEHADSHDKELVLINEMVKSELSQLHNHFEGVVAEMEAKEELLLKHIASVEQRLEQKLQESKDLADQGGGAQLESGSHFWPYMCLLLSIMVCAGVGVHKIKALKTEDDFFGRGRKRSQ